MNEFYLKNPDYTMLEDILAFRKEFLDVGDNMNGSSNLQDYSDPEQWLKSLEFSEGNTYDSQGNPPSFQCVYVNGNSNSIVGMIQYRNNCNRKVIKYYGNIGYCIRPSERRKGYAKRMLSDMISKCSGVGVKKLSLVCRVENEGSRRVIVSNGGILQSIGNADSEGVIIETYKIDLPAFN